ncbi:hypothetical protein H4S08_000147 [Coemansia sp. RSA 1365]|nr:hypothetical protein H4S08_000147 [Coemansia sp. RSA 1365]
MRFIFISLAVAIAVGLVAPSYAAPVPLDSTTHLKRDSAQGGSSPNRDWPVAVS